MTCRYCLPAAPSQMKALAVTAETIGSGLERRHRPNRGQEDISSVLVLYDAAIAMPDTLKKRSGKQVVLIRWIREHGANEALFAHPNCARIANYAIAFGTTPVTERRNGNNVEPLRFLLAKLLHSLTAAAALFSLHA